MTPDALAALHARCFKTPPPWSAADFAAFIADPLAFLLVEGDAGFLLGRTVAGEAEILTLAVAPEARQRGLGRKLLARFQYQAFLRGAERLEAGRRDRHVDVERPALARHHDRRQRHLVTILKKCTRLAIGQGDGLNTTPCELEQTTPRRTRWS